MKRFLMCTFLGVFSLIIYAQSIGGFLDFYLGQSISDVRNVTYRKYPTAEWKDNECTIRNIRIAGESFKLLLLTFENNSLVRGRFIQSSTNHSCASYEDAKRFVDYNLPQYVDMISRLYAPLVAKYGKETYSTDTSIVWKNGNSKSITIQLRQNIGEGLDFYTYSAGVFVDLIYEISRYDDNF